MNANTNTKFEAGNIYEMNFIGDSQLKPKYICVKRTKATATLSCLTTKENITRRIKIDHNNNEYILDGSYSMSPSIRSNKVVG